MRPAQHWPSAHRDPHPLVPHKDGVLRLGDRRHGVWVPAANSLKAGNYTWWKGGGAIVAGCMREPPLSCLLPLETHTNHA